MLWASRAYIFTIKGPVQLVVGYWGGVLSLCISLLEYIMQIMFFGFSATSMIPDTLSANRGINIINQPIPVPGTGKCCFRAKTENINDMNRCARNCIEWLPPTSSANCEGGHFDPREGREITVMNRSCRGIGNMNYDQNLITHNASSEEKPFNTQMTISTIMKDMKADNNLNNLEEI